MAVFIIGFSLLFPAVCGMLVFSLHFAHLRQEQSLRYYQTYLPILYKMLQSLQETENSCQETVASIRQLTEAAPTMEYEALCKSLRNLSDSPVQCAVPSILLSLPHKFMTSLLFYEYCRAAERDISLHFRFLATDWKCALTDLELINVCGILLDNAIEASISGDVIYLELSVDSCERLCLAVKNPGPEANPRWIRTVFSQGYTTKSNAIGHGLGLSYVKETCRQAHCKLAVHNENIPNHENTPIRYVVFRIKC